MKSIISTGFAEADPSDQPHFDRAIVRMLAEIAGNDLRHGVSRDGLHKAYLNTYGAEVTARVFHLLDRWNRSIHKETKQ